MFLAIDAGNTNIVFAVVDGDTIRAEFRASTKDARTADEYAVWLVQLLGIEGLALAAITDAIIATVVPAALFNLRMLCRKYLRCEPLVVGEPGVQLGVGIDIDRPEALGADRIADTVAAHRHHPGDVIVVDFGTATTFNVVSREGSYKGGVIAPGVNLSLEALHLAAAKLPHIAIERPRQVIGRDTVPAMQSGVYWGYVAMVEGVVARIKAEYGKPMTVVATGGLASLFRHAISAIDIVDKDLTVRGLIEIWRRNRRPEAA